MTRTTGNNYSGAQFTFSNRRNVWRRKAEAEQIASTLGSDILVHGQDWSWFSLNDDLNDYEHNAIWRTTFDWQDGRFEGHVYNVKNAR